MDNNYNMSFDEAQDYISKRGFDILWNDDDFRTTTTHVFLINDGLVVADSEEEAIKMFRKEQIKFGGFGKVKSLERMYGRNDSRYDDLALIKDFKGKNDPKDLA